MPITHHSPPAEKIALFRSLFRGRTEVYPLRFESVKTGKAGYSPVCGNEWVRGICEKPRIKCSAYAAGVRRLIRDGVDTPLAQLFVHATRAPSADAVGAERARSASEAFIFRCFESLPALAGQFQLNAKLPIPFDDRGEMEVDLLCEGAKGVMSSGLAEKLAALAPALRGFSWGAGQGSNHRSGGTEADRTALGGHALRAIIRASKRSSSSSSARKVVCLRSLSEVTPSRRPRSSARSRIVNVPMGSKPRALAAARPRRSIRERREVCQHWLAVPPSSAAVRHRVA